MDHFPTERHHKAPEQRDARNVAVDPEQLHERVGGDTRHVDLGHEQVRWLVVGVPCSRTCVHTYFCAEGVDICHIKGAWINVRICPVCIPQERDS